MAGAYRSADATAPAFDGAEVTPSDVSVLRTTRSLYIGAGGTVVVDMIEGGTLTFVNVPSGSILPLQVQRVRATGTTASNIIALY